MKILVLGGAGFIGSRIARWLVDQGHEVDVIDDLSTGRTENVPPCHAFRTLDVTAASDVYGPATFDAVYHFASPASPDVFVEKWDDVVRANIGGAMTAASLLRPGGLLVLASSSEAYGQPLGEMSESCLGQVRTQSVRGVYDESKRLAEAIVYASCRREQIRGLVLRIFNTYGPGMPDDGRVINTFVRQAQAGEDLTVHGAGSQSRSFSYVDDTVGQIMRLTEWMQGAESGACEVFNVGCEDEISIMEAARLVASVAAERGHSVSVVSVPSPRAHDPVWRRPILSRLWRTVGQSSYTTLEEGVRRCF